MLQVIQVTDSSHTKHLETSNHEQVLLSSHLQFSHLHLQTKSKPDSVGKASARHVIEPTLKTLGQPKTVDSSETNIRRHYVPCTFWKVYAYTEGQVLNK